MTGQRHRVSPPGRLLIWAALLWLASISLLFVPRGVLWFVLFTCIQFALLVHAVRLHSRLWPIHAVLLILTALPPIYIASRFLAPPDGL